ncbi:MAG: hypothetical protein DMG03_22000 [Acidobacteria bacterium]|nr:MAG: hypothetical protein DMG03_22000 [Acidobacteriota bacterium]
MNRSRLPAPSVWLRSGFWVVPASRSRTIGFVAFATLISRSIVAPAAGPYTRNVSKPVRLYSSVCATDGVTSRSACVKRRTAARSSRVTRSAAIRSAIRRAADSAAAIAAGSPSYATTWTNVPSARVRVSTNCAAACAGSAGRWTGPMIARPEGFSFSMTVVIGPAEDGKPSIATASM